MRNFALNGALGATVAVSATADPAPASEEPFGGEASLSRRRVATKSDITSLGSHRCRVTIVFRASFGHNKTVTTASGTYKTCNVVAIGVCRVGVVVKVARHRVIGS